MPAARDDLLLMTPPPKFGAAFKDGIRWNPRSSPAKLSFG